MLACTAALTVALALVYPPANSASDVLVVQAAVQQPAQPIALSMADDEVVLEEERQAQIDLAFGAARLGLIKARARVAKGRYDDAIAVALKARQALDTLPEDVDRSELVESLEQVVRQAEDARAKEANPSSAETNASDKNHTPVHQAGMSEDQAFRRDAQRYQHQADLTRAYKSDEADALVDVDKARRIPGEVFVYPSDWPAIVDRRRDHHDGIIWAGPEFANENGVVMRSVVYDVSSLIIEVPDFTNAPILDLTLQTQVAQDRQALRQYSQIFTGSANDLASGIPLLLFFGGVDDRHASPVPSRDRQADLMRIIDEVIRAR